MNRHEADELVERLVNSTTGWTPESIAELAREVEAWRDTDAADEAVEWVTHEWQHRSRPPLGWIVRAYNEARGARLRQRQPSAGAPCAVCDGTRSIECVDDRRHAEWCPRQPNCGCHAVEPCPACNGGDPGPGRVRARLDVDEYGYSRTRIPSLAEGKAIARANYEAECRAAGREPNPEFFERIFASITEGDS